MSSTSGYTTPSVSGAHDVKLPIRAHYTEIKDGFKTSEFYVMAAFVVAVLVVTYLDADSLAREDGWRFAAFAVIAYIVSRGLAKIGVREPANTDH